MLQIGPTSLINIKIKYVVLAQLQNKETATRVFKQ